jgi:hypothetical protein
MPRLSSSEASEYEKIHNRAFNISSPSASTAARSRTITTGSRLRQLLGSFNPSIVNSPQTVNSNRFLLHGRIELPGTKGGLLPCTILLDTGSEYSILGFQIARKVHPNIVANTETFLANGAGGGHIFTLGETRVRWNCLDTRLRPRFENSSFHMAANDLDVDIIIGWQDLIELDLVRPNAAGYVNVITRVPAVDSTSTSSLVFYGTDIGPGTTARRVQSDADARRQAEDDEMRRDELKRQYEVSVCQSGHAWVSSNPCQQKREAYARNQAVQYAQDYAIQHRLRHGETGLQQAYGTKYREAYRQIYNAYPQRHHPPPMQ